MLNFFNFSLVDEECLPYDGREQKCSMPRKGTLQSSGCKSPQGKGRLERYHVSPAYRLGNETDIMYEILNSGPAQGNKHAPSNDKLTVSGKLTKKLLLFRSLCQRLRYWPPHYPAN